MPTHFGLDIGTHSVKLIEIDTGGQRPVLTAAAFALTPPKALVSESPEDYQALGTVIKQLHASAKIETNKVVASLPESQVFSRIIELPTTKIEDISSSIRYEAEQYIPIPMSEVRLDYQIVSQGNNGGKTEVLIVAAPLILINKFLTVQKMADLEPIALETEILATSRTVYNAGFTQTTMVISLGNQATDICIVDNGLVIFTRSISTGGAVLARAVAQELGFELDQAEQYKRTYGLDESQMEGKVVAAIKPVFDIVVDEIRRAMAFFANKKPDKSIQNVIVAGGTAKLPGLTQYLSSSLGIPVEILNPWNNIDISQNIKSIDTKDHQTVADYLTNEAPTYTVAVGLALRKQ